jgi:hypothetical protein
MKKRKMDTFISFGMLLNKVETSFLMPGIALKVLRGLKTLRFLKAFRLTYFFDE